MSNQLRIRPLLTEHPVQPHRQSPRHHHLGYRAIALAHPQPFVGALQLLVPFDRALARFHQQKPHQARALLADVSQPPLAPRAVLGGHQPQIRAHRPRRAETAHLAQRQHRGQRRLRPYSRMRLQPQRRRPPLHLGPHPYIHLRDLLVQLRHPLQQIIPPPRRVLCHGQTCQQLPPRLRPQPSPLLHPPGSSPALAVGSWPPSAPAPDDAGPAAAAAPPALLPSAPRSAETAPPASAAGSAWHLPGRSSSCPPPPPGCAPHPPPTTRAHTRPAGAGTTDRALLPQSPLAPARPAPADCDKTPSPPADAPASSP